MGFFCILIQIATFAEGFFNFPIDNFTRKTIDYNIPHIIYGKTQWNYKNIVNINL